MNERPDVFILDDEEGILIVIKKQLSSAGIHSKTFSDPKLCIDEISKNPPKLLICDNRMPLMSGIEVIKKVKELRPNVSVIMLTAYSSNQTIEKALSYGVSNFLKKPYDKKDLIDLVISMIKASDMSSESNESDGLEDELLLGKSDALIQIRQILKKVAPAPTTVLLTGESGSGKGHLAQLFHKKSGRTGSFISINCAAIPANLIESELFGYAKGAFTGADKDNPGKIKQAEGGTLFLDEISELPLELQPKLLHFLQDGQIQAIGKNDFRKIDTRIITASNQNLDNLVKKAEFRQDLYFRLSVINIHLPSLRERREDIRIFVNFFLKEIERKLNRSNLRLTEDAFEYLESKDWPGNVRELENSIERAVLLNESGILTIFDFANSNFESASASKSFNHDGVSLRDIGKKASMRAEKEAIEKMLLSTGNNVSKSAKLLGVSRRGLQLKMREFGMNQDNHSNEME